MGNCLDCNKSVVGVELDLVNSQPSELEIKTYNEVQGLLKEKEAVFKAIEDYKGCQELARAAMSKPSSETERAAFEGLLQSVTSIAQFYQFSQNLEIVFPKLVTTLANGVHSPDKICKLNEYPGLTQQLATILNLALNFDRVRMLRPNLSNDFSYYRRLLPKFTKHPNIQVKDDEASGMALFTGLHIPMTTCLYKAGAKAQELLVIQNGKASEGKIGYVLSTMANSCMLELKTNKNTLSDKDKLFLARAMTGAVVIFDHVDPLGAFHKRTPIGIKKIILLLKQDFGNDQSLINAIRYSSKNFRAAPDPITRLIE